VPNALVLLASRLKRISGGGDYTSVSNALEDYVLLSPSE
jgi:hypothetical protein